MSHSVDRRGFLKKATALGMAAAGASLSFEPRTLVHQQPAPDPEPAVGGMPYEGPRVVLVRFGGGVRRLETIQDAAHTYCPFIYHELVRRQGGALFTNVEIEPLDGVVTSHGQGTLYILTGKYDRYEDITHRPLADRFEAKVPTIFEYFREKYNVPSHEALIINGEDRVNEEFYTFSNHHQYGIRYRSTVLSLYRFKTFLLREEVEEGRLPEAELAAKRRRLEEMENLDYRVVNRQQVANPRIDQFWRSWRDYYGSSGLVNPRGDSLLTTLALRAIRELRPKLMMINYQDPDYVHWGNRNFYTRAISIIDDGVRQIHDACQADPEYRDNTVFVIVPDCGRDNNPCMPVPFQHHFNSLSAHQIFAVISGPASVMGRTRRVVDVGQQQIFVARTIGDIMNFATPHAAGESLMNQLV